MAGEVIPLRDAEHKELKDLLPWYVTGQLDAEEAQLVSAHVAACAECQAEIRFQRRLESEVARLPLDVEAGWDRMKKRLEADNAGLAARMLRLLQARAAWLGAGMAAALVVVAGVAVIPGEPAAEYRALSAGSPASAGNVVAMFRPETTEAELRAALRASGARLVDGPTAAGGYVLRVEPKAREAALERLRASRHVVLAQPIDGAP